MTAAEFTARFNQFKQAQPEYKTAGFKLEKLEEWQETFFQKVLADVRRQALNDATSAISELDKTTAHNTRSAVLNEAYGAVLKLK